LREKKISHPLKRGNPLKKGVFSPRGPKPKVFGREKIGPFKKGALFQKPPCLPPGWRKKKKGGSPP